MSQGLPSRRLIRPRVEYDQRNVLGVGMAVVVAQLDEEVAIRLLLEGDQDSRLVACRWAQGWVDRLDGTARKRASIRAERLLAICLAAAGRMDEARNHAADVLALCARTGLMRYPLDGGTTFRGLVESIHADLSEGRPVASGVPRTFLDQILAPGEPVA